MGTALWQFKPQFSSATPRFEFRTESFGDMDLSVSLNDGRVELTENGFAWNPMDENGRVLMEDRITFSLTSPDGGTAYWGKLYLSGARLENGTGYCFTAELTGTGLYLVDSWNLDGGVIIPASTAVGAANEDANGNTGTLTVLELAPGITVVAENTIVFEEDGGKVEYTLNYGRTGLDVELGLVDENGVEIFQRIAGGSSQEELVDIPAGSYHFFFRNSRENLQYADTTTESLYVDVAVMHYEVTGGTLQAKSDTENAEEMAAIASLLEEICTSPALYSAPSAYIEAHPEEYQTLIDYGDLTLQYITQQFLLGGQTDLRSHIMRTLLDDLTEIQLRFYAGTGQEYFDVWLDAVKEMADNMGMKRLAEEYPGVHLVVAFAEEWEAGKAEGQKALQKSFLGYTYAG